MNFKKRYINLCKNPKVQGLRPKFMDGDWIIYESLRCEPTVFKGIRKPTYNSSRDFYYWLPTNEQLDEEILNICRKKFNDDFQYEIGFIKTKWYGTIAYWKEYEEYMKDSELMRYATDINEDPLICKLKLLIALLKEK